jgi:hypothetical protein
MYVNIEEVGLETTVEYSEGKIRALQSSCSATIVDE